MSFRHGPPKLCHQRGPSSFAEPAPMQGVRRRRLHSSNVAVFYASVAHTLSVKQTTGTPSSQLASGRYRR